MWIRFAGFLAGSLMLHVSAAAQSFNIDFGQADQGPPSSYAAAGQAGYWNSLPLPHTSPSGGPSPFDVFLRDLNGDLTNVRLHQFGGTEIIEAVLAGPTPPSGNDALLLKDALITHSIPVKTCLFFNNLLPGLYEVTTYAWTPNQPEVTNIVFHDFTPGVHETTGDWPGQHVEGVTYTRHYVNVTTGFMGPHEGLPNDGDPIIGSALNGIQLRRIEFTAPASDSLGLILLILAVAVLGSIAFRQGTASQLSGA